MSDTNKTREYLEDLPFNSAKELKEFREAVERNAFEKILKARFLKKVSQKEEFQFWQQEFQNGMVCLYGKKEILRVNRLAEGGTAIIINTSIAQLPEEIISILFKSGALIKATSSSFLEIYYRANGFLSDNKETENFNDLIEQ